MTTSPFLDLIRAIVAGDIDEVARRLDVDPGLAAMQSPEGATRRNASEYFFDEIGHYLYAGDTALHMGAARFSRPICEMLVANGAKVRARNRRGAEPLHYASDADRGESVAQADVIEYLLSVGADPNAVDKTGVAPIHRAVRKRSFSAVRALLNGGANPTLANKSGSTPLHLAVQTTGSSGSGTDTSRRDQELIIKLLLEHGASPADTDGKGKTVEQSASSDWIRDLLVKRK